MHSYPIGPIRTNRSELAGLLLSAFPPLAALAVKVTLLRVCLGLVDGPGQQHALVQHDGANQRLEVPHQMVVERPGQAITLTPCKDDAADKRPNHSRCGRKGLPDAVYRAADTRVARVVDQHHHGRHRQCLGDRRD